jgi:parvulin-like peptidyl-prolyl isomerase
MKRITIFTLFSLFTVVWCFAQQADLQTVATVSYGGKTEAITVRQLRTEVERLEKSAGRPFSTQERRNVLDVMINERLAIQAAEKDRITVSENEVNQQMNQLRTILAQNIGRQPTDAEFATAIKNEYGLELAAFRDQTRRELLTEKYLRTKKQSIFDSVKVPTDAEITSAYNLYRTQFVRPETVRFSMIQVAYGADAASRTRAKELIDRLAREIGTNPSKFDEVVLRAQVANSGFLAGDGGYLPRNAEAAQVVGQDFITTAFNLKQGEVSKVIEGRPGYQIIKITETYAMKNLELDDIVQIGTNMTVRSYIGNSMWQERQMEVLKKASDELVADLRKGNPFRIFDNNLNW